MKTIYFYLSIVLVSFTTLSKAQSTYISDDDRYILNKIWNYADTSGYHDLNNKDKITLIAQFFLETPYVAGTLDIPQKELPIINLRGLDCVTFVENTLALAALNEYNNNSLQKFIDNITKLRYRNLSIDDYSSRLHYSTDWLYEMQKQSLLKDVTANIGGIIYDKQINFMTTNYTKYKALANNTILRNKIKTIENNINSRSRYYIPKSQVNKYYDKIENGDIILITTTIKGLDTSHLGFAIKKNEVIYLLHASSDAGKVVLSTVNLYDYLANNNKQSGIIVARVK